MSSSHVYGGGAAQIVNKYESDRDRRLRLRMEEAMARQQQRGGGNDGAANQAPPPPRPQAGVGSGGRREEVYEAKRQRHLAMQRQAQQQGQGSSSATGSTAQGGEGGGGEFARPQAMPPSWAAGGGEEVALSGRENSQVAFRIMQPPSRGVQAHHSAEHQHQQQRRVPGRGGDVDDGGHAMGKGRDPEGRGELDLLDRLYDSKKSGSRVAPPRRPAVAQPLEDHTPRESNLMVEPRHQAGGALPGGGGGGDPEVPWASSIDADLDKFMRMRDGGEGGGSTGTEGGRAAHRPHPSMPPPAKNRVEDCGSTSNVAESGFFVGEEGGARMEGRAEAAAKRREYGAQLQAQSAQQQQQQQQWGVQAPMNNINDQQHQHRLQNRTSPPASRPLPSTASPLTGGGGGSIADDRARKQQYAQELKQQMAQSAAAPPLHHPGRPRTTLTNMMHGRYNSNGSVGCSVLPLKMSCE